MVLIIDQLAAVFGSLLLFLTGEGNGDKKPASVGYATGDICVHGTWETGRGTCNCASGWTTNKEQDILAGPFVWCNATAPPTTEAPPNGWSASALGGLSSGLLVIALLVLLGLAFLFACCFCCRRRSCGERHSSANVQGANNQQQPPLEVFGVPFQQNQPVFSTTPSSPMYMMPLPMYANATVSAPTSPMSHSVQASFGPTFLNNEPYGTPHSQQMDPQQAVPGFHLSMSRPPQPLSTDVGAGGGNAHEEGVSAAERDPSVFTNDNFHLPRTPRSALFAAKQNDDGHANG
ncbi:putative adenylate kinase [Trypanosoma grayi]|uniref:putative adenylate kinase n=1 Tax=Trypanosoma grayi TaxID=71804 RepID=UPI0004F4A667|nr:putative adenylate kinase [Trypanosoma grayi]KEG13699.1 putative adenylate kinase [Trypanosoma grayi]